MNPYCPPKVQRHIGATGLGHQLFGHVSALLLPFWGEEETRTAESRKPPRCARSLRDYVYFGSRSRTSLQSVEQKLKKIRISDILTWSPMTAISSFCNIYHVLCRLLRRTFNFSWIWSPMTAISSFCNIYHVLCRLLRRTVNFSWIWSPMTAISSVCNIYHVLCRLLRRTFNFSWIWSPMTAISSFCNIYHVLCRLLRRTFNLQLDLVPDDSNQFVL